MKIANIIIIAVIVLLSVAAGMAKVMQTPEEMEFLQRAGLNSALIVAFGLVQIAGGVLLVPQKTRLAGAVLAAAAFGLSTILIFMDGNLSFALISMLPVALAGVIVYQSAKSTNNES